MVPISNVWQNACLQITSEHFKLHEDFFEAISTCKNLSLEDDGAISTILSHKLHDDCSRINIIDWSYSPPDILPSRSYLAEWLCGPIYNDENQLLCKTLSVWTSCDFRIKDIAEAVKEKLLYATVPLDIWLHWCNTSEFPDSISGFNERNSNTGQLLNLAVDVSGLMLTTKPTKIDNE